MPIPALVTAPPVISPGGAVVVGPNPARSSTRPTVTLSGPDGSYWVLTDPNGQFILQPGATGLDLPPTSVFLDSTPGIAGASYSGALHGPRAVFLPVYTEGADRYATLTSRRAFLYAIDSTQGMCTLTVSDADGAARYLDMVYTGGAEGAEGRDNAGMLWQIYGLNFIAPDPYFYGLPVETRWGVDDTQNFFPLAPDLFRLSSSQILGGTIISNPGDVEAYPVWTLTGPCTSLTLQMRDSVFTLNSTLALGETITINTDPAQQIIVDGTGANRWPDVAPGYDLWAVPGFGQSNDVIAIVDVAGAGVGTSVTMSMRPRYLKS